MMCTHQLQTSLQCCLPDGVQIIAKDAVDASIPPASSYTVALTGLLV